MSVFHIRKMSFYDQELRLKEMMDLERPTFERVKRAMLRRQNNKCTTLTNSIVIMAYNDSISMRKGDQDFQSVNGTIFTCYLHMQF